MLLFDFAYFSLVITVTGLLASGVCEDVSTVLFERRQEHLQYISTRLMQCKYIDNTACNVIPWLFALLLSYTAVLFDEAYFVLVRQYRAINYVCMLCYMILIVTGVCMVVRFDEDNLAGTYGELSFAGFKIDTASLHKIGVVLLLVGIFTANFMILSLLMRRPRNAEAALLWEFSGFEILYATICVFFLVFFFLQLHTVAAFLEFGLASIVIVFSLLARHVVLINKEGHGQVYTPK